MREQLNIHTLISEFQSILSSSTWMRLSTSYKEMQIKTAMRNYNYILSRMAKMKKLVILSGRDREGPEASYSAVGT